MNEKTALKPKGHWDKSCIFLLLSFYSPLQGVRCISTHCSIFCSESLQQSWRHWGSVPHKHADFNAEDQTKFPFKGPLNKQAQKKPEVRPYTPILSFTRSSASQKYCTSPLDNLYQVHQLNKTGSAFHRCCKDKSSEQSQWARSKWKCFRFVSRKRLSSLHTARVKSEPGKLPLLWWMQHAVYHIISHFSQINLPTLRTDTSSKILHPKPVRLKSKRHTNSSCCFTEHKEEFYCFSYNQIMSLSFL